MTPPWWQSAVIYQVYPRSFQDSNADGIGDLNGILRRLDYLVDLGIQAIWISPIYPSPMADFGYDVSNYTAIDPLFGTLADFDTLLAAIHARGLKLILDFVPNHTSDQHPWFLESRSSLTNPKRDWYLWQDSTATEPPNNWLSNFGGTAWTFDQATKQSYYHSFLPQQPDLNWRNPAVKEAMFQALRFWLSKGVDGFRMDVLWLLIKDDQFRNNLPNPDYSGGSTFWSVLPTWTADQPETHTVVREMRTLLNSYEGSRLLIGEIYLDIPDLVRYYEPDPTTEPPSLRGAQLPFNFHLIQTPWQAPALAQLLRDYEAALPPGAWPNYVLGNHDQHRLATRIGPEQARVAAMLILTLRGTPTLYYGDELGLPDGLIPPGEVVDPAELRQPGLGFGRDPERCPLPWNNQPNAGFTPPETRTWLPLVQNWPAYTVESESYDPHSSLALYKQLLTLRKQTSALTEGTIENISDTESVLSYTRTLEHESYAIHLNLSNQPQPTKITPSTLILTTCLDQQNIPLTTDYTLRPNEAILLRLN